MNRKSQGKKDRQENARLIVSNVLADAGSLFADQQALLENGMPATGESEDEFLVRQRTAGAIFHMLHESIRETWSTMDVDESHVTARMERMEGRRVQIDRINHGITTQIQQLAGHVPDTVIDTHMEMRGVDYSPDQVSAMQQAAERGVSQASATASEIFTLLADNRLAPVSQYNDAECARALAGAADVIRQTEAGHLKYAQSRSRGPQNVLDRSVANVMATHLYKALDLATRGFGGGPLLRTSGGILTALRLPQIMLEENGLQPAGLAARQVREVLSVHDQLEHALFDGRLTDNILAGYDRGGGMMPRVTDRACTHAFNRISDFMEITRDRLEKKVLELDGFMPSVIEGGLHQKVFPTPLRYQ